MMFADDLLLLARADESSLSLLFGAFDKFSAASGLSANLDKTEVYFGGINQEEQDRLQGILGVEKGTIPFKYLGVPLSSKKLSISQCKPLVDKVTNRINSWTSRHISYAGRIQMIKGVLFGIQTYWAQIFILPKKIIKEIEAKFRTFLWTGQSDASRKATVSWAQICLPKICGGWNILSLYEWNQAAITRTLWDIHNKNDSLWVKWVHMYYLKGKDCWSCQLPQKCSWMLKRIMKCRSLVDQVGGWDNITMQGKMNIKKLYNLLKPHPAKVPWRRVICNNKASPKSLFILWLAVQNRLATKDRLQKWHISCDPLCALCGEEDETLPHLFFDCKISSEVWKQVLRTLQIPPQNQTFEETTMWVMKCSRKGTEKAKLITMFFAETIHSLWLNRNNKVFGNNCKPPAVIVREVILKVALRSTEVGRQMLVADPLMMHGAN